MKIGMRTPSPDKMIKAKTTGRVKRAVNRSVNPVYGRKGAGFFKDPERAVKNKLYHELTYDPLKQMKQADLPDVPVSPKSKHTFLLIVLTIVSLYCDIVFVYRLFVNNELHIIPAVTSIICLIIVFILNKT